MYIFKSLELALNPAPEPCPVFSLISTSWIVTVDSEIYTPPPEPSPLVIDSEEISASEKLVISNARPLLLPWIIVYSLLDPIIDIVLPVISKFVFKLIYPEKQFY